MKNTEYLMNIRVNETTRYCESIHAISELDLKQKATDFIFKRYRKAGHEMMVQFIPYVDNILDFKNRIEFVCEIKIDY